jgi:hypothetical protein
MDRGTVVAGQASTADTDDLTGIVTVVSGHAGDGDWLIVPGVPEQGYGPEVQLGAAVDVPGFLALADRLGGGVIYLRAVPFDPRQDAAEEPGSHIAELASHAGKLGQVSLAFVANGVVHFWERSTPWYEEWEEQAGQTLRDDFDLDQPSRPSQEERARLVSEHTETLFADPRFRAARQANVRHRAARLILPPDTGSVIFWDAVREASEQADELAQQQYERIEPQLDELSRELLASPDYQRASSPPTRRRIAGQFLIPRADGFSPPAHIREELYAKAQQLAKKPGGSTALF